MARMNSQDRSLQIIAKQNGWDPTQIIDDAYRYKPNGVMGGDSMVIPGSMTGPSDHDPEGGDRGGSIPEYPEKPSRRTTNADPFPDMPGAR